MSVLANQNMAVYRRVQEEIEGLVGRINGRFGTFEWTPIMLFTGAVPLQDLIAYFRAADVCWLTPLRDGLMTLHTLTRTHVWTLPMSIYRQLVRAVGDDIGSVGVSMSVDAPTPTALPSAVRQLLAVGRSRMSMSPGDGSSGEGLGARAGSAESGASPSPSNSLPTSPNGIGAGGAGGVAARATSRGSGSRRRRGPAGPGPCRSRCRRPGPR